MNRESALHVLLQRLGAGMGAAIVSTSELRTWPPTTVATLKASGLIVPGSPAAGVVCPGCEQQCFMPVHPHLRHDGSAAPFVLCDKRSDTSRVRVPPEDLELWQSNGEAVAALLALHLNIHRSSGTSTGASRWEVGLLKGKQHAAHVVLLAEGDLRLAVAGHTLALTDVLEVDGEQITVNKLMLTNLVDQPRDGAGSVESAQQRRSRLKRRVTEEKLKGTKGFLKVVAAEENMGVSRLKQLLDKT